MSLGHKNLQLDGDLDVKSLRTGGLKVQQKAVTQATSLATAVSSDAADVLMTTFALMPNAVYPIVYNNPLIKRSSRLSAIVESAGGGTVTVSTLTFTSAGVAALSLTVTVSSTLPLQIRLLIE
jgi:hypothetical protein